MLRGMGNLAPEEIQERLERLEHLTAVLQGQLGGSTIQKGTVTLVAGQALLVPAVITATSRIQVSFKDAHSGANANTAKIEVPAATRVVTVLPGTGSFNIRALTIADALNVTDVSTVDWEVIN